MREVRGGVRETPRSVNAAQDCLLNCVGVNGIFFMMSWELEVKMRAVYVFVLEAE